MKAKHEVEATLFGRWLLRLYRTWIVFALGVLCGWGLSYYWPINQDKLNGNIQVWTLWFFLFCVAIFPFALAGVALAVSAYRRQIKGSEAWRRGRNRLI